MDWSLFFAFVGVGLLAQLVDGALGMAYGLVSSTILLALGIPPAAASASVHAAEVVTTGVSGVSHAWFGNVDRRMLVRLAVPGVIGGALGAYVLSQISGDEIRPWICAYLFVLGAMIVARGLRRRRKPPHRVRHLSLLGFVAALCDAIGGGGWGAMTNASMLAQGAEVRRSIGTANAAEFFVTAAISATFFFTIGVHHWPIVAGLLVGGVIAAPLAAWLVKRVPERPMLGAVGTLIAGLSVYQLVAWWGERAV
jgi:uncharacterized protein